MNFRRGFFAFFLFFSLFSRRAFADRITFAANSMRGNAGGDSEYTMLEGNASVETPQMSLRASQIELSGKDFQYITAAGAVSGKHKNGGFNFFCDKITYDRISKVASLEGNVKMEDSQNDVVAESQFIEYNEKNDIAVMQIGIRLVKGTSTCTAAFAIYRKEVKILEMSGNPQVLRDDDTFRAQEIVFNIDTEEIVMDGNVEGKVTDSNKTEPPAQKDGATQGAAESSESSEEKKEGGQ